MRKRVLSLAAIIILSIASSSAFAQSPQISTGISWLYSAQTTSGNWPQVVTTDYYSTASALDAIYLVDPLNSASGPAFQWLSTQIVSPTDYLSRQVVALKRAGHDTSGYVASLLLYHNSDGGFGGAEDCPNSYILDTALALQALSVINYSDTTLIGQSLSYLTTNQNSDGGWGFSANDASNTYITSAVLRTLAAYNSVFINQNSINQASAFLLTHQNTDGGFGNSPSTVYDTATSLMSLIESGQGSAQTILSGISYLTSSQLADGSWNDDPYSTALALQALAEARPNLAVSSSGITFSNTMPLSGTTTTISAVIANTGYDNASNVIVRFYLGDPAAGGTQIGTDQLIPFIALGSSAQASITQSFTGTGGKTIFVVVDPNNLISETSKLDNKASASLWVATAPDLAVYSQDLIPSTYIPTPGTAFTLSYTVRNLGESPVGAFAVSLYDGDPTQGGTLLQTANVSGMNGSDMRTGTMGVTPTTNGSHTLYFVADSGNAITEITKTNNTGTVTVNVGGTQTLADLAISPADIMLTPARPHAGDAVLISANVHNIGADVANNFTVEFFDGAPEAGGTLIAVQTISLVAGGSQTVTANWPIPSGIHDVYVVLDRMNAIIETNENNNRASVRVMTDMVDITLSATDLVFSPSHPVSGDTVALSITDHNTGIKDTGAFNLAVYNGDPNAGGVLLQTSPISDIAGDGSVTVTYAFTASPQTYRFYAVADPENKVVEMYKDNNTAIRSLTILGPGQTLGPDLVPLTIDLTATTTDPQTLAISGTAHVTFQNIGDDKITTPFNVIIFEDKDGDGKYTSGVDTYLGTGLVSFGTSTNQPALWPEGIGTVDIPLSGTVTFLHSPLYALVDSGDVIVEQNKDNNILVSCNGCQVVPANQIQPSVKWKQTIPSNGQWLIYGTPTIMHLRDTNGDGKIDQNDVPDIVLTTLADSGYGGKIWAFKGDTGENYFSLYDPNNLPDVLSYPSSGDIDGSGKPSVIFGSNSFGLVAYNNDWTLKWNNNAQVAAWKAANPPSSKGNFIPTISSQRNVTSIADLDGDGKVEIISGPTIINADGSIRCVGRNAYLAGGLGQFSGYNGPYFFNFTSVADLNLDGHQEIVAGNAACDSSCNTLWLNSSLPDGVTAIANFGDAPYPEIVLESVVAGDGVVYLLDHTGKIKWGPVSVNQLFGSSSWVRDHGGPSQPIVADFDGAGKPEIGIRSGSKIIILDKNGVLKNTLMIPVYNNGSSSDNTAPTVFDLDGDGIPEVMINSGGYFTILNGKDGSVEFQDAYGGDGLMLQNVFVADVDGDGQVELVVFGSSLGGYNVFNGMRVYHSADPNHPWTNGRRIWNQPSYHVTNINDDGSIPQHEAPSWMLNNSYITQAAIGKNPNPYLTPNLTASDMRIEQAGLSVNLAVRIGNGGAVVSPASVLVTFYDGNPASGGTVIGTASTTKALNPGDYQDVVYSWAGGSLGLHHVYAVVDAANAISECRKDDNQSTTDVTIVVEYPDLTISPQNIVLPAGPYYAETPVPVTATISNIGGLSASNVTVRLYNGNPASGGVQAGTDQVVPLISVGGTASVTFSYDTLGKAGTNVLYVVIDPANAIAESSKANNSASVMFLIQQAVLPDLAVSATDIQLAPAAPQEGNTVTITATLHNLGTTVGNIPVSFYLGNPASGGALIAGQTIYPAVASGATATAQASFNATGWAGQQQVYVVIDPLNSITESNKSNNSASEPIFIQSAGLSSSLSLDKPTYLANDTVTGVITAVNATSLARTLSLSLTVVDTSGNLISTISSADPVTIGPNSSTTVTRTWNTGKTLAGSYTMTAALSESGSVVSRVSSGFAIAADTNISASITTDKISYNPNDTAALTSTITSKSANYPFTTITAVATVSGPSGTVLTTDTRTLSSLMPGASYAFKTYWGVSTNPTGTYTVTLSVMSGQQSLASSSAAFGVLQTTATGNGLAGLVTAATTTVNQGTNEAISYRITNNGNADVSNLAITILIVNPDTQAVMQTFASAVGVPMGQSISGSFNASTASLAPRTYLAILQAQSMGMTQPKTLGSAVFTVLDVTPPVLTLSMRPDGSITNNPTLNIAGTVTDNVAVQGVTVNNTAVQVNADGTFSQAISLSTGTNTITTIATDTAGNTTTDTRTITLDQTAPVITITNPADNSVTNIESPTVTGTVDKTATVSVQVNSGSPAPAIMSGNAFNMPVTLVYGLNTIQVTATDLATNTSTAKRTVILDNVNPVLAVTYPAEDAATNQSGLTLQGTVADIASTTVTIAMDGLISTPTVSAGTFQQALMFTTEKQYAVMVTATDAAGNTTTVQRNIIFKTAPPALAINPVATPTNQQSQTVAGTMDAGATVDVACPTATVGVVSYPTTTTWQAALSGMTEGTNTVSVTAEDQAGNVSNPITAIIVLDTIPPVTTATPPAGIYGPGLLATLTSSETATIYYTADGSMPSTGSPIYSAPIMVPASATLRYFAVDLAGNPEVPKITIYVVDALPPTGSVSVNGGALYTNNPFATLTLSCVDAISGCAGMQFSGDAVTWSLSEAFTTTRPWTLAPGDGSKTIYSQFIDGVGNISMVYGTGITLDTTLPTLRVSTLPDGSYTNNATLNIAGTAADNIALKGVTINDAGATVNPDGTFSQVLTLVTGTNTITTAATDMATNIVQEVRTITLDQTVPVVTITTPADNSVTNQINSAVTGTVDKNATLSVFVNGVSPEPSVVSDATFSFPVSLVYGQNTIQVTATDLAGNIGTAKRTVTLDNQNPSLSVTYPIEDMTTNQGQMTLTGQVSDLTPVTVTVAVDGHVYTPAVTNGSFTQTITFTAQKTYQISVTAVDEAGNQSLAQRNVIYNAIPQNFGVFGATSVDITGGYVDSYDSTQGAYSGVHGTSVTVGTNATTNGAINLSGSAVDYGDAYVGPGGNTATAITTSGGAIISGAKGVLSMLKGMTPMSDLGGGTPATFTNGTTLTSGTYRLSSINLSGSGIGTINGNVTLYVTGSLSLSGSSQLVILPSGSLTIYLDGSLTVSGGSIVNETLDPHNLTIYGTSTCTTATYSGSSAFYGVIYAPMAQTTVSGGNVYGSVIGKSVTISGGAAVHYDSSLGNMGN